MIITVNEVGPVQTETKGKNTWKTVTVKYTGDQGDKEKVFRSFGPDYKFATSLEVGKTYDVGLRKENNFWVWNSVAESGGAVPRTPSSTGSSSKPSSSPGYWDEKFKLDLERFEFDKDKQPLIVRQSCIGYAVEFYKLHPESKPTLGEVLETAHQFEQFVHSDAKEELLNMEVE